MSAPAPTRARVLVAFDKLKGALDAREACDVAARVIQRERPAWRVDVAPLTDGGDGFCSIATAAAGGTLQPCSASGPLAEPAALPVQAAIGLVELARVPEPARLLLQLPAGARRLALVEMASASGLGLVAPGRVDVWRSSSRGTGELLLQAARSGADAILLGVGGSATSDLGLGALGALGLRFLGASGAEVEPMPARWPAIASISGRVQPLPPLRIACDVDNPVLGARGAAAVYGPQKGLAPADIPAFDAAAERIGRLLCSVLGASPELLEAPGAGAAGGIAFGLAVAAGARLVSGSRLIAEWLGLEARVCAVDGVLTGEGRFDESSACGKGPGALLELARRHGRPCVVFAGSVTAAARARMLDAGARAAAAARAASPATSDAGSAAPSCELIAISPEAEALPRALARTRENLEQAVCTWIGRGAFDAGRA